jgi:tRNA pseudouridine55 synthase
MEESGWININKPKNYTSTRIVSIIKGITRAKKVGHGGTLDPLASGVLPLCINKATKQVEKMINHSKEYLFELTFGEFRTTFDSEGEIVEKNDFVPIVNDIEAVIGKFIGIVEQIPPSYSAIKINGKRSYDLARSGEKFELEARKIEIHNIEFNGFVNSNTVSFTVECGRGCYIRSLGVDIAKSVGAIGYVSEIKRLRVGDFLIEDALEIDKIDLSSIKKNIIVF